MLTTRTRLQARYAVGISVLTILVPAGIQTGASAASPSSKQAALIRARAATPPPTVSGLSARSGWYGGGTRLTVHGTHFVDVTRVKFGTVAGTSLHVISSTRLKVTTPAHSVGSSNVRVVTDAGTSPAVSDARFSFFGWALTSIPKPPQAVAPGGPSTTVQYVACWKQDRCAGAGSYTDTSGDRQGSLWTLSGRDWSVTKAPLPSDAADNANPIPARISCGTGGVCVVIGTYRAHVNGADSTREVVWTLSAAGQWTLSSLPLPPGAAPGTDSIDTLSSRDPVSCGGTQCAVVGSYRTDADAPRVVLWTLTAGTWRATKPTLPGDAGAEPSPTVGPVACESSGTCAAMGLYSTDSDLNRGALWRWTGTAWTVTEAPTDGVNEFSLNGMRVSCGSGGVCAGVLVLSTSVLSAQLWTVSGKHWSRVQLPTPAGADTSKYVSLDTVSCASNGLCAAAGSYTDTNGDNQASLWSRSSAGSWNARKAPLPANAADNPAPGIKAMSCGNSGDCLVSGVYAAHRNGSDEDDSVLWLFSANSWSRVPGISLRFASVSPAVAIACNARFCAANVNKKNWTESGGNWRTAALPRPSDTSSDPAEAYSFASRSFAGGTVRSSYYSDSDSAGRTAIWVYQS